MENRLEARIALNYRAFHAMPAASGALGRMPPEIEDAVLRGFQTQDFLHVATGYGAPPGGEIALRAFSLAQLAPCSALWISVVTIRMTFHDPDIIVPLMDDMADGWQSGRQARNISFLRREDMLTRPLDEIRRDCGLARAAAGARRQAARFAMLAPAIRHCSLSGIVRRAERAHGSRRATIRTPPHRLVPLA